MRISLNPRFFFLLSLLTVLPASAEWRAEGPALATINDVAISANAIYASTYSGGVWRSDDGGATWHLPGGGMTSRNVVWVQVDPGDDNAVWAGVKARGSGSGLWRSGDRAATWEKVAIRALSQPIAFAPSQPKTVFVPATNHHYRSKDGGKTWTDFRVPNQDAYVFAVHPTDPQIVLAGGRGSSLNVSRSMDGGETWRQIGIGLGQSSLRRLFFEPGEPSTVYAVGGTFGDVFKSVDQGENWSELSLPIGGTSKVFSLNPGPGGKGVLWAATQKGLLKSSDGGASWHDSDSGFGSYLCKAAVFDPSDASRMLAGTSGSGVYRSADGGANWEASSQGLAAGWTEKLWGSKSSDVIFAQMSVGFFRRQGIGAWVEIREPFAKGKSAEIQGVVFDRSSDDLYAHAHSRYWRSSNGGKSWRQPEQKGPSMRDMMKGNLDSAQFASLIQDPGEAKVFYAGSWSNDGPDSAVFKTKDGGKKWKPAGRGLPGKKVQLLRSEAASVVFAVVPKEGLYRTTDGAGNWKAVGSGLPDAELHELAIDPADSSRLFAATEEGLFRSTDNGDTWARVEGGLAGDNVRTVVVDAGGKKVFAGTFEGVYQSADGGTSWSAWNEGLPNTDIRALAVGGQPIRLWAGTAGGSVYSMELTP